MSAGSDLLNMMRLLAGQQKTTVSLDGYIYPGSYNPVNGTVAVTIADSAALCPEVTPDEPNPLIIPGVALSSHAYGALHGPLGGERVTIKTAQGGTFRATFDYDEDDSPGTPAGETWTLKYKKDLADLTVTGSVKLTNDGANEGDDVGAVRTFGGGYAEHSTGSGHALTLDDTNLFATLRSAGGNKLALNDQNELAQLSSAGGNQLTLDDANTFAKLASAAGSYTLLDDAGRVASIVSAAGHSIVLNDATGTVVARTITGLEQILDDAAQEIASVAPRIALGDRFASLPASAAAIAKEHLTTLGGTIDNNRLADLLLLAQTMVTAGIPNASALVSIIVTWVVNTIGATAIPEGSEVVKLAG